MKFENESEENQKNVKELWNFFKPLSNKINFKTKKMLVAKGRKDLL